MQAILAREFGGPEVLKLEELPEPAAGAGQVRVRVHAVGVNPYAPKPPHFKPRATAVISLFMGGGWSQVDTFDPKPALAKHAGDPSAQAPRKLAELGKDLCLGCHAANVAKPKGFKQIDGSHGDGGKCSDCHGGHAPEKGPS